MRHCQIQCNFGGIDDLRKLGKECLTAVICKLCTSSWTKIWNFWRITRLSIISRCKVIWSQNSPVCLAHPVYWGSHKFFSGIYL